ncbi:trafficking protein particle complex subunit 13-like [Erinaceus europaeus]|uniref:Trafficking protein particle complex subunit 13-like n=1 Tax=Erinaceus europaeus TaxID=9365 RepID=A0A1S2ZXG5_ERIEU|nr:trafficking protein particle complex subunit 13-like [Erinaceus europaeus]
MFFRKMFLSPSHVPLEVKTKCYNSDLNEVYLEVQIKNISSSTIFIQKVSLELSEMYTGAELNIVSQAGEDECTFGTRMFLQSMEGRQYLYNLQLKQEFSEKVGTISRQTELGKLIILWKRNLGEMAVLQTIQLERESLDYGNLRLSLEEIPETVILEKPFNVTCKITNCSDRKMKLVLRMNDTDSVRWCGTSERYLGKLSPNSSLCFSLTLLSLKMGLQSISGICITDKVLRKSHVCDNIAKVFVVSSILKMKS